MSTELDKNTMMANIKKDEVHKCGYSPREDLKAMPFLLRAVVSCNGSFQTVVLTSIPNEWSAILSSQSEPTRISIHHQLRPSSTIATSLKNFAFRSQFNPHSS
jgi:hypothetical protein